MSSLQQRWTTLQGIMRVLQERARIGRAAMVRHILEESTSAATSMGELDLREECRQRGLPEPRGQRLRRDASGRSRFIDFELIAADGVLVMVEVDGTGHMSPETWIAHPTRQRRLVVPDGTRFVRVSTWELRYEPGDFFESLTRALRVGLYDV